MKYCKVCSSVLPSKRVELGYVECTDCSTEEKKRKLDVIYHKTGNTLEHLDAKDFKDLEKRFLRKGFRSHLGAIKGNSEKEFSRKIEVGASTCVVGSNAMFEKVGEEAMEKLDLLGLDRCLQYLDRCYQSARINQQQYTKLKNLVGILSENSYN